MAGGGASRLRKRVEAESSSSSALKRAKDGSAFAKCEECNKDVPVALISFHNCSLDAKIKMNLEAQVMEMPSETKKKSAPEKEEFRKSFKEGNPECKSVAMVAKEGGEKWKSMSDEDKKVYIDRAAELKAEYEKALGCNDVENEQDVDDSSEKEVKEEEEADDSSEKEIKEVVVDDE
ncbi:UNVERIFIED_CONTAM: High mobility group B protein 7 [Sesamum radiatum]|uniref:High mobility group B protein 7 n=1 Tax=Sesamum radiatum TaxID=300843 RepID=A0AAW2TXX3_SESRA